MFNCKIYPDGDCGKCERIREEGCGILEFERGMANGSPYRKFGFPKKDLRGFAEAKDWVFCPNCGWEVRDDFEPYEVDGVKYPQYYNETLFSCDNGTTHDWDEVHCCPKCKTQFVSNNGCF